MFLHFLVFEIKYRLARVSTYVYFAIWFFMTFFAITATNFGPVGTGKVYLNGPYSLAIYCSQLLMFGIFVVSALFGTAALRDFHENTYQLLFTKPISKFAYLGGRWAGSMVVSIGIFTGILFGTFTGTLMPWVDRERIAPFQLWWYLQPFLSLSVLQIFFLGSVFFAVGALTRKLMVVYLQGVVLFGIYLIAAIYIQNQQGAETFWTSVLDPLGMVMFQNVTKYWSVAEKNSLVLPWEGAFLYNRLLWAGVGVAALAVTWLLFPMSAEALTSTRSRRRADAQPEEEPAVQAPLHLHRPAVRQVLSVRSQLWSLTMLRFRNILREAPFWAIVLMMLVIAVVNARHAGRMMDTPVWPVTYLVLTVLQGGTLIFFYVIATLYTGEAVWRERDVGFDQIHDSLPFPTWLNAASQFLAVAMVTFCLLIGIMLAGIVTQASLGYFHFEIHLYLKEMFLIGYPGILMVALLALFFQTMLHNKFLGHAAVIGLFLLMPILYRYGVENRLLLLGDVAPYTYSDMNGYGHFVAPVAWSLVYWLAFSAVLGAVAVAFARRGTDLAWSSRKRVAMSRGRRLAPAAAAVALIFAGSGVWFYYNAHVLNPFETSEDRRRQQAEYERRYKQYQYLPQPKITAVEAKVDIYPERRSLSASGHYLLVNRSSEPIREIHISGDREVLREVRFDRAFELTHEDKPLGYRKYQLREPLAPGASMRLDFQSAYESRGFRDGGERNQLACNGTFFDNGWFPSIGYQSGVELTDPTRRKELGLPPQEEMPPPGDERGSSRSLFTPESEWITFRTTVSTSPDQIAIAPGYLKREWTENGRRHFEYDMGDARINNFYSYVSGRYKVRRETYKGVALEIYYHPGHEYNLERMLQSSRRGLDYFQANFSPYQFRQFRIIEFPRYRGFAQSFPNTVPYSEALGFIQRVEKADDIDNIFYITAHELAHQWWGHQLIGSHTQGSNMMSETLAQYSAMMIMEQEYGPHQIRKFLKHELDRYLRGRSGEKRREPPLMLVQREPYVWYNKGSLAMYAMRDYIGEDKLNAALREFLMKNRYATGTYPDTRGFVAALRRAAPPELQQTVTDLFERIVLFDNRAVSAKWSQLPDNRYKVELTLETRKLRADGLGAETEMAIDDLVDIGVFAGDVDKEPPVYLAKHRITGPRTTVELVVDRLPSRAGIDPYHKLIDRKPDDNVTSVSRM